MDIKEVNELEEKSSSYKKELINIKKLYGEQFMHLCRLLFPTILEQEGVLLGILESSFAQNSRTLSEDITEDIEDSFANYIINKVSKEEDKQVVVDKNPYELLEEAGYDLYECISNEDIQSYKKYYESDEELCTFRDKYRLESNFIFWAVKKNVDEIKRENFIKPKRDDEYGTSVISIQFSKGENSHVSIKNRYNHIVDNPDATFGNNLDRIIPGLQHSFAEMLLQRGMKFNKATIKDFEIPGYTIADDGKYYKYNLEINGNYYCPGNVVISEGKVKNITNPEEKILVDQFLINLKEKRIIDLTGEQDFFVDVFDEIEKIEVIKSKEENVDRIINIQLGKEEKITIGIDKNNQIVKYINNNISEIGNGFLKYNKNVNYLELPKVEYIGNEFLMYNMGLTELNFPYVKSVGNDFLKANKVISQLNMQQVEIIGDNFLHENSMLNSLELPKVKTIGDNFLDYNNKLFEVKLPQVESVGNSFLGTNRELEQLELPQLQKVENNFIVSNNSINNLKLPKLKSTGDFFLGFNKELRQLELSQLESVGIGFLAYNEKLEQLELPQLKNVGMQFMNKNKSLTHLKLPQLENVGGFFMCENINLTQVELPHLKEFGKDFLVNTKKDLLPKIKKDNSIDEITVQEIARLDKNTKLTISEIGNAKEFIENIKENNKENDK